MEKELKPVKPTKPPMPRETIFSSDQIRGDKTKPHKDLITDMALWKLLSEADKGLDLGPPPTTDEVEPAGMSLPRARILT